MIEEISKITFDRHRQIRELLVDIREFDGIVDVEAFSTQSRRVNS